MDPRAAKLALARKKLKDHQDKKVTHRDDNSNIAYYSEGEQKAAPRNFITPHEVCENGKDEKQENYILHNPSVSIKPGEYTNLNITEVLISNERNLEQQLSELQLKLVELEKSRASLTSSNNAYKQDVVVLENQIQDMKKDNFSTTEQLKIKENIVKELSMMKIKLSEDINSLQEQLEFTKNMLTTKESENSSLQQHLINLQNQLDVTQLQLQQVTNGSSIKLSQSSKTNECDILQQKINTLEHQLKTVHKEKEQISSNFEHYVNELNEQLKAVLNKNQDLTNEIQLLSNRENSLVEQISDMEIRLQNYQKYVESQKAVTVDTNDNINLKDLQSNYDNIQVNFNQITDKYNELLKKNAETEEKLKTLIQAKESKTEKEPICMTKLNADIASDKVAVQRATEQNKKLKIDLQELEEAFVKISKDKLELLEKLEAEKFLNRELTIKLADIDENAKDLQTKLFAKDEEMIRLQTNYKEIKSQYENLQLTVYKAKESAENINVQIGMTVDSVAENDNNDCNDNTTDIDIENARQAGDSLSIHKGDAMLKLQERFLKIMDEVADLSDEKHRLEHIILQLQNETDTVCEYIALYQEQRSLLKKRDEDRNIQIKIYQAECAQLKHKLEELSNILTSISNDTELVKYFQDESKANDLNKVMKLLFDVKNSSLIDPNSKCAGMNDFHPCNCCSGKLIDV